MALGCAAGENAARACGEDERDDEHEEGAQRADTIDNDMEVRMESQIRTACAGQRRDLIRSSRVTGRIVMLSLAGMFVVSQSAYAQVILIDQAKAMAGNVTPGDAPGFPVSITRAGSYRLSSRLRSPSGVAIEIVADNVSLNLNGFAIVGSNVFPSGDAIIGDGRKHVRIHNGSVVGFSFGIRFQGDAQFVTLEKLHINSTTIFPPSSPVHGLAIRLGENTHAYSVVRDVVAEGQIQITCPSLVIDTITDFGVVEMDVPFTGFGRSFPTNCKGTNVF